MNVNDECPFCKSGTLEKNGEDLVCRGECGGCFSAEFQLGYQLGYAAGHSAGRRSHPASRSFMQSLQREVAVIAAAMETT